MMKGIITILFGLAIILLSFQKQDNIGKTIFEKNCKSCHLPNKATAIAPSFQNIRKDYGLKWTLAFIKNSRQLKNEKDIRTLYSYYVFGKHEHIMFPVLEAKYVTKVLDYVDEFPVDTSQFRHRLVSFSEKKKYVYEHSVKDTVIKQTNYVDTATIYWTDTDTDTAQNKLERKSYRRINSKRKGQQ